MVWSTRCILALSSHSDNKAQRGSREIGELMQGTGVNFIDSPVMVGFGAQGGTLTMMAAVGRM